MKKLLSIILFVLLCCYAMAYDFSAVCSTGQTLFYNITSDVEPYTVEIVPENESSPYYNVNPSGDLEIPETVEYNSITYSVAGIGNYAFRGCSGLTSVAIPNSVTSIGDDAFYECSGLLAVYFTGDIEQWCGIVFEGYSSNPLMYAHNLYFNDELLTDLVIPNTVTQVKAFAFYYATCITSITIGSSVSIICNSAFERCTELTGDLILPNSLISIGIAAFRDCSGLTGELNIPDLVTDIGKNAFNTCTGFTGALIIPNSVASIGEMAFRYCRFTSVVIGNSVTSIGRIAFDSCEELTSVTIGRSVDTISEYAFDVCENITDIYILANTPPIIDNSNAFTSTTYSTATLWTPCGLTDTYGAATNWSSFTNIQERFLYELNVSSSNEQYGTASIRQQPDCTDAIAVIEATPNQGYQFVSWNDGNAENPRTITVTSDSTFVANFEANIYTITVLSNNDAYGMVSGGGTYEEGSTATISATPYQGYRFVSWNDGNTDNPRTIIVTHDSTFTARFVDVSFWFCDFEGEEIWTVGNDQQTGNVQWQIVTPDTYPSTLISGDNAYLTPFVFNGDTLNITPEHWALADLISQLTDFGGPGQVAESSWIEFSNINLTDAENPQITFRQIFKQLNGVETSIRVSTDGGQTWTDHIVNEEVEDNTYGEYEIRTGIREAAGEGNVKIRFLINSDAHVVQMGYGWEIDDIEIKEAPDTIIATAGEGGTISPNGEVLVELGESVTFTITPNDGYRIASVMVDETENVTDQLVDGTYTFVDVIENHTIAATFEEIHTYTIIVLSNNDAYGMVSEGGTFEEGAVFEIAAMPNDGYRFVSWDDGNMDNPRTIIVTSDSTFVANFIQIDIDGGIERRNVLVELFAYKNCGYSPYAAAALDNMEAADSLNIIVIDHHVSDTYGYTESMNRFYYWAEKDDILGQSYGFDGTPSVVFDGYLGMSGTNTNVDEMQETYIGYYNNVKAIKSIYSLTAELEQTEFNGRTFSLNVTAEKHSEYFGDDQIVVMAALAEDIDYDWSVAGKINNLVRVLYPDENGTEAIFDENNRFSTNITIDVSDEYDMSKCKVVVWIENHTQGRVMQSKRFNVMDFYNLQAQQYTITVLSNNEAYGSVSGGGTYEDGDTIIITAIPNGGYLFDSWEDGNFDNPRSITVTSDSTFIADFVKCEITQTIDTTVNNFVTVGNHTFYSTGNYSFSVLSENDCDTIFDIRLRVLAEPVYDIGPNPAKSLLNINSDGFISAVEFYSVTGQLVMRKEVNGYEAEFDMEGLVDGVYILRIYGEESSLPSVSKVVKE